MRVTVGLVALLLIAILCHAEEYQFMRSVRVEEGAPIRVQDGRIWKVEGLSPSETERGVGTADLYIDGQIVIGKKKDYNIAGKFDILINRKQTVPIWVTEGSTVEVGDSRNVVVFKEYAERP